MSRKSVTDITPWVIPTIHTVRPYAVEPAEGLIKLDAMESSPILPEAGMKRWLDAVGKIPLHRYPDANASALRAAVHAEFKLPNKSAIVFGNGSDELIQLCLFSFAHPDNTLLTIAPTFFIYKQCAKLYGIKHVEVPLDAKTFSLDIDQFLEEMTRHHPCFVCLAQPNNPTGTLFSLASVRRILEHTEGPVIIDEAYFAYSNWNALELLKDYGNAIIMRTVSKIGLAGIRLGMVMADAPWTEIFNRVRAPYNVNALTQQCALAMLGAMPQLLAQAEKVNQERDRLYAIMSRIKAITVWPSAANFLLFRVLSRPAHELHHALRERGILIKDLSREHQLLSNCLRVSMGTSEENDAFLEALQVNV